MRIGILSDTHDHRKRTARAVGLLIDHGAEVLIHCGDLTGPDVVRECAGLTCYYVFGNNDFDFDGLTRAMHETGGICLGYGGLIDLAGKRLAVTHGDRGGEMSRLLRENPHYLFTGHTHAADDSRLGPTRWINPGALHRASIYTVATLDLDTDTLHHIAVEKDR